MHVEVIPTEELGDRSYVVHDGSSAVVVDPQRDLDRVEAVLESQELSVELVLETHIHNDYVTGGHELARRTGARYVVNGRDDVTFERYPAADGEELRAGSLTVRVVASPGHTDTHLSYVVTGADGSVPAAFTGGSLLYGSVGRTDLIDPDRTDELTRAQYRSVRRLAAELPDRTGVYPTHGFGSFCSSGSAGGGDRSTIGGEKRRNEALTEDDEDVFVERLVAGLTAYPSYYAHMGALNRQGPGAPDLSPVGPADADAVRRSVSSGEWVVDLREGATFAARHVKGTISIALGQQFATYLGWLIPWGTPLTLLGESEQQVADAQRQLVRIGIERPAAAGVGDPAALAGTSDLSSYDIASFSDLRGVVAGGGRSRSAHRGDDVVLDVRRVDERARGGIPGSLHVPLGDLVARSEELPDARLWVYCASGYRAGIAASLLDAAGRDVVLVDDEYANAVQSGVATG